VRAELTQPTRPGQTTVTLTLVNGRGEVSTLMFDERSTCLIGQGEDCSPRPPNSEYVCESCQANPEDVMTLLVKHAQAGTRSDLSAIAEYTLLNKLGRHGISAVYLAAAQDDRPTRRAEAGAPKGRRPIGGRLSR